MHPAFHLLRRDDDLLHLACRSFDLSRLVHDEFRLGHADLLSNGDPNLATQPRLDDKVCLQRMILPLWWVDPSSRASDVQRDHFHIWIPKETGSTTLYFSGQPFMKDVAGPR